MLTGVAEVSTAVECLKHGAFDYIAKPFMVDEVRARVDNALEKRRLVLENRFLQQSYQERLESSIRELDQRNKEQFVGQIQMAVRMLEKKDVYTRGHSQRVSRYAVKTAVILGFTGDVLDQIRLGGELHDIGKIGTRDSVLNKPGPLTAVGVRGDQEARDRRRGDSRAAPPGASAGPPDRPQPSRADRRERISRRPARARPSRWWRAWSRWSTRSTP